ncbi:tRNA pseudouridine synthase A [Bifidobacterium sp. ESL0745]|uniref:tRNA pseudouridine synthase A n=1 Tax=Bifidobacterium sp. ESL0745 TaxID=2983226 RepID=UPI0023F7A242|nr:tRNA pseudouridine synthase A [Bifidobacterium sp. ESL0745]MDF7665450.1 tRNA pseudouridine synthase A [Bifidobacterium sp. ESL0745]
MRLRIDLAYDGGGFHGWARQPDLRTVQGVVENALHTVLRVPVDNMDEPLRLVVAGRTDTGVHAAHQVCHLDVQGQTLQRCVGHMDVPAIEALRRRLNHDLPEDIALHGICVAPNGFDARFSALERTYVYRIADGARPADPRLRGFVWELEDSLDIPAMNEAAAMTLGLHDFGSFATPNPGGTTIREVKKAVWRRVPITGMYGNNPESDELFPRSTVPVVTKEADKCVGNDDYETNGNLVGIDHNSETDVIVAASGNGGAGAVDGSGSQVETWQNIGYAVPSLESGLVCFTIVADAFAHNMVRSLVNACVQIGRHRKSLDWFAHKMADPVREGSTGPIAACGLTLEHVAYPPDDELAGRAQAIRARRTLD